MAESSWPTSEVMQEHLQNLVGQGYMTAAELAICCVLEDPASPTLVGDTSWRVWHSMSEDLVWIHIDFSACCYSSMSCSCIT
jgi:hypothetical protein